jgi:hypothetical protein
MKKSPRSLSGCGGRSEEAVPQLGGPHPSRIRLGRTRPNTTIVATTLPGPEAGPERSGAAGFSRPTMVVRKREGDSASRQGQCFRSAWRTRTSSAEKPSDFMLERAQPASPKKWARACVWGLRATHHASKEKVSRQAAKPPREREGPEPDGECSDVLGRRCTSPLSDSRRPLSSTAKAPRREVKCPYRVSTTRRHPALRCRSPKLTSSPRARPVAFR